MCTAVLHALNCHCCQIQSHLREHLSNEPNEQSDGSTSERTLQNTWGMWQRRRRAMASEVPALPVLYPEQRGACLHLGNVHSVHSPEPGEGRIKGQEDEAVRDAAASEASRPIRAVCFVGHGADFRLTAAPDNTYVTGCVCAAIKLYLRKTVAGWILPASCNLPTAELEEQASKGDFQRT